MSFECEDPAVGWSLSLLCKISGTEQRVYGFDSFEGFPQGSLYDSPSFNPEGKWKKYRYMSEVVVRDNLIRVGVDQSDIGRRVFLVKGFFPESFDGFMEKVSLVHLDVDLYQSYKDALEYFYPLLEQGGYIIFDEYDHPRDLEKWPGAKIAIDEFSKRHKVPVQRHWTGYSYFQKS
jgi:hypothetical protein